MNVSRASMLSGVMLLESNDVSTTTIGLGNVFDWYTSASPGVNGCASSRPPVSKEPPRAASSRFVRAPKSPPTAMDTVTTLLSTAPSLALYT